MESTTEESPVAEAPVKESGASFLNLLTSETPQESATKETPAETTEKADESTLTLPEVTAETGDISLEDEAPAAVVNTETGTIDDFEAKFNERLTKEFGVDATTLKTKLSTPAEFKYKTSIAELADKMEVGTKMSQADFFTYVATDHKALTPIELLDFDLKLEMPSLTAEERATLLEDRYKTFEDATPQEKVTGKYQMEKDHKEALAKFEATKAQLVKDATTSVTAEAPQANVELETKKAYWKTEAPNVVKMFDKLPITLKVADPFDATKTVDIPVNFNIPEKDKANLAAWVETNGAFTGAENKEAMLAIVQKLFIAEHAPKLIQKATERALSHNNEAWTKRMANYQPPKGRAPQGRETTKTGSAKELMSLLDIK